MALRDRPEGFRGGIARWVTTEEAREIAHELGALGTVGELMDWSLELAGDELDFSRELTGYRYRVEEVPADTPVDGVEEAAELIVSLASRRRHASIAEFARAHRIYLPSVLDGGERSLGRCPTCDEPIDLRCWFDFYCREHLAEQRADAAGLQGLARRLSR
jgi:hypothetical protein